MDSENDEGGDEGELEGEFDAGLDATEVGRVEEVHAMLIDARSLADLLDELDPSDKRWADRVSLLADLCAKAVGRAEDAISALIDDIFARRRRELRDDE